MQGNLAENVISVDDNILAAKKHIMFQHNPSDSNGYITLAKKENGKFIQYHYRPKNVAEHLTEWLGYDVYYSQNSFYTYKRSIENIRQLRSLYVDLDIYTKNLDINWVLGKLEHEYYRQSIPEPNAIIHSGRGLVLIWLIEPVPYMALPLWNSVQNYLLDTLKDLGGDSKAIDAARVFRIAGSKNSSNNANVRVEYRSNYRYSLREIQFDYLPELTPKPKTEKKKPGRKKKVIQLYNIYSLYHARILDIVKLVELREYNIKGYRETICFLYRYWMCCFCNDTVEAYRQTAELNSTFTEPLPEKELRAATKSAEKAYRAKNNKEANELAIKKGYPGAGYNISNKKLIDWLDITNDEMVHLRTIIDKKEVRRRDYLNRAKKRREEGIRTREQRLEDDRKQVMDKAEQIKKLLEEDSTLSLRQLVSKTGFSRSTVQRLKKLIDQQ